MADVQLEMPTRLGSAKTKDHKRETEPRKIPG